MATERMQRRTERLLDQIDAVEASGDWQQVHELAQDVLDLDEDNSEARAYLRASERRLRAPSQSGAGTDSAIAEPTTPPLPTSFASGRYEVKRFLGEGGKG